MAGHKHKRGREGWTGYHPLRPDFEPGNDVAVTHGAYSPARVGPRTESVLEEITGPASPDYVRSPVFGPAMRRIASRVAQAELAGEYLDGMPIEAQMEPPKPGTSAPIEILRKLDVAALGALSSAGLTPVSAAKMTKSLTGAQVDIAALMAEMTEEDQSEG